MNMVQELEIPLNTQMNRNRRDDYYSGKLKYELVILKNLEVSHSNMEEISVMKTRRCIWNPNCAITTIS